MLAQENYKDQNNKKVMILEKLLQLYYYTEIQQIWVYIISAIGEFQYITFLWVPISMSSRLTFFQKHINYHSFMMYFCRLDEIIYLQFKQSHYYFLIPLIIQIVFFIVPLLLIILFKKNQKLFQFTFCKIYLASSSILNQIFMVYLFLPLTMLASSNFVSELKTDQQMVNIVFCFISLLLTFIILLYELFLCRESVDLKDNKFQKFNQTILSHLNTLLLILQILIYHIVSYESNGQTLQCIIVLAQSLIKVIAQFQIEYIDQNLVNINLIVSSYGITSSISLLIQNINSELSIENIDTIILLVFMCLSRTLISIFRQKEQSILNGILHIKHYKIIKYYLSKIIYDKIKKEDKKISDSIIFSWLDKFEEHSDSNNNNNFKNFKSTKIHQNFDFFIQKKLKQFVKSVQKFKGYDLHYVCLLNKFGFSNLALMQLNQLLSKQLNLNRNKGFLADNGLQESNVDSSQRQTGRQSVSSKSLKSNTDEINDIALRNQTKRNKLVIVGKQQYLSSIEQAKASILKTQIKMQVQKNFFENNSAKSQLNDMKLGVELFLKNEKRNQNLRSTIIYIINEKIKFFQQFTSKKSLEADHLFKQASLLSDIQLKLENKLFERYQQFPSQKIQSILIFYQGEILNNFIEAYKYRGLTSMPDEQLINMDINIKSAFFTKKIVYLNLLLEYNQNLLITSKSENALKFFQISSEDAKQFQSVDFILPLAIRNEHSLLVQKFTQDSKSKFYLNSSPTFFKLNNLIIKSCSLLFDIHFDNINHYKFSAFFSDYVNQSAFILVDINYFVGGITESFFEKLGLNEQYMNLFNSNEQRKLHIEMMIPNFKKYVELKQTNAITELRFIKQSNYQSEEQQKIQTRQLSMTSTNWSCVDQLHFYEADIIIQYQELYGYYYYIIEVRDAKLQSKSNKSLAHTIKSSKPEEIEEFFKITELSEIEAVAHTPKISRIQKTKKINYDENYIIVFEAEKQQNLINQQVELQKFQQEQELSYHQVNILSPNMSNALWQDSSQIPLAQKFCQQDYFQKDHEQSMSAYQSKNNNQDEMEESRNFNNKIIAKQKQQLQEDQSSSKNVFKGIKQSQFYKKYESINQLIEPRTPNSLKLFIMFSELTYLVSLIYFIVILFNTQIDLNRFIGEIDMIQLHAGIMNPHDLYLQIRQNIITYNSYLVAGKINATELKQLTDPLYENVGIGYYEFKEGFIYWLGNAYLTPFLKDQNITAYYMQNGSTTYPIVQNIRETMMATLNYYYDFKLRFEARLSTANQTYQVYQFANIYNFHVWLEQLTMEVYQYSKNRSIETSNKWTIIWILFIMINLCPLFASLYYFRYYYAKFDSFVNLFKYCSSQKMEMELEKFKYLLRLLNKNQEILLNYSFDIEQKEEDIQKSRISFEQQKVKDIKIQQQFKKLSFAIKFILVILGWLVFLGLSIVSNIRIAQYLNKYSATADAYKLIQDMSLYAGTLYRNRDFGLAFPNYPYLREFDKEMFHTTIKTGLDTITIFLKFSYTYEPNNYQTSEEFFSFFKSLQEQDMCTVLGDEVLGFLKQYCEKSLSGTLKLGLFPTLKFIWTSISTQYSMNNFTKRLEFNKYENEGSLIVLRSFQLMSKQFKIGMVNVTEQQITISNIISIIYLIYSCFMMILFAFYLLQKMKRQLELAKRFILLIPSTVLFLDDQFERHVRILIAGQEF